MKNSGQGITLNFLQKEDKSGAFNSFKLKKSGCRKNIT